MYALNLERFTSESILGLMSISTLYFLVLSKHNTPLNQANNKYRPTTAPPVAMLHNPLASVNHHCTPDCGFKQPTGKLINTTINKLNDSHTRKTNTATLSLFKVEPPLSTSHMH